MSIYRVYTPPVGDQPKVHQAFGSSEGAAKQERRRLSEAHDLRLDEVKYEKIDLESGKAGIIAYLNAFCAEQPGDYAPAGYEKAAGKATKKSKKKK